MKNKTASAQHLEIILAFIIFSSFIFFLIYFIPIRNENDLGDSTLITLKSSFENSIQKEIIKMSIKTNTINCFSINSQEFKISPLANAVSVKVVNNSIVKSYLDPSGKLTINSNENFFEIIFSDDLLTSPISSCPTIDIENYTIGGINKLKVISNISLTNFIQEYKINYEELKQGLGIPINLEFGIKISGTESIYEPPKDVQVKALSQNYLILYPNGDLENKDIIFQIWS